MIDTLMLMPEEDYLTSPAEYWRKVQNPATRISDSQELVRLAHYAYEKFADPHIRASALNVIVYRILEGTHKAQPQELEWIYRASQETLALLLKNEDFASVRWTLSLNMALAALRLWRTEKEEAVTLLMANIGMIERAIPHGQPLTNVVKSAIALLGILRVYGIPSGKEEDFDRIVSLFSGLREDAFAHYKYGNHWVFEELALVYRCLFSIGALHYAKHQRPDITREDMLAQFDMRAVTAPYSSLLMPHLKR